jgi:hypothetical protein
MKYQLYTTKEQATKIISAIKEEMYNNITSNNKPTKEEFFTSFDRKCGTALFLQILNRISDDLSSKS